ncbi:hypothetical protein ACFTAO_37580 [Paenibacillus rhizoplanae]
MGRAFCRRTPNGRRDSHAPSRKRKEARRQKNAAQLQKPKRQKGLEFAVAALLLTGKLKVDSIQMYTDASMFVSLVGKYKTLSELSSDNVDKLVSFLDDNSSLTLNEIMTALKKRKPKTPEHIRK